MYTNKPLLFSNYQLKTSIDLQIKAKDEEISKKMGISLDSAPAPKSPKGKGKKGK